MKLTEEEIINARATLSELQVEHHDLNLVIDYLGRTPPPEDMDQLLVHRLKKRKLMLKDKMYLLEKTLGTKAAEAKA